MIAFTDGVPSNTKWRELFRYEKRFLLGLVRIIAVQVERFENGYARYDNRIHVFGPHGFCIAELTVESNMKGHFVVGRYKLEEGKLIKDMPQ